LLTGELQRQGDGLEIPRCDADILAEMGDALANVGQPARARQFLTRAMYLNPLCPDWYHWFLGDAYFCEGNYERAIDTLRRMRVLSEAHRLLTSSDAHLGKLKEARQHAVQLMKVHPNFSIDHWREVSPVDDEPLERLIDGMRKAGLR
jgi:adenylate cyclase